MKTIKLSEFTCPNCGMVYVGFKEDANITKCLKCGSSYIVSKKDPQAILYDENDSPIRNAIKFNVNKNDFLKDIVMFLIKGRYTPDDILEKSEISLFAVYVPVYIFHVEYAYLWRAQPGYYEEEVYYEKKNRYRADGSSYTEMVRKTRIVLKWHPVKTDIFSGDTKIVALASKTLDKYSGKIKSFIEYSLYNKNLDEIVSIVDSPADVVEVDRAKTPVWNNRAAENYDAHIVSEIRVLAGGNDVRGIRYDLNRSDIVSATRAYLPVFIGFSEYKDNKLKFIGRGTDGEFYYIGKKPQDEKRNKKVNAIWGWFKFAYTVIWLSFIGIIAFKISGDKSLLHIFQWTALGSFFLYSFLGLIGHINKQDEVEKSIKRRKKTLKKWNINADEIEDEEIHDKKEGSSKSRALAAILAIWFGFTGMHNFYLGKTGMGIFEVVLFFISIILKSNQRQFLGMLILVILGIIVFFEHLLIMSGSLEDGKGQELKEW